MSEYRMMLSHQQDDDGVISCQHRTACPQDPTMNNRCSASADFCCYDAKCRVPIPTLLSQVAIALADLVETSEDMVEILSDQGGYHRYVDAARENLDAARIMLKHEELSDARQK